MYPFTIPWKHQKTTVFWCFQRVEQWCIGNEWINQANKCTQLILGAKQKNIANMSVKCDDPKTAQKTYWSILSRFSNNKRIPIMPPVLVYSKLICDFKKKSKLFNSHFDAQCTVVNNASTVLGLQPN